MGLRSDGSFALPGKVAMVTGGRRGIGLGVAEALTRRGARVAIVDLDQDDADAAAARVGGGAFGLQADVTDRGAMQATVASVVEQAGGLDLVVANAGIAARAATVRAMHAESFDRVLDVDLNGVVNTVTTALPQIAERSGHVVVTSSVYAFINGMGAAPYAMAKAGVEQLGRALRVELAPHGAGASVAYFGFIDTEMVHRSIDDDRNVDALFEQMPKALQKRLTPAQAGETVARGIERRQPRIITPRRWAVYSALRGVINPLLDDYTTRNADTQAIVRDMDSRGDEEQPLTA